MKPNVIGIYGPWAAALAGAEPGSLSFRNPHFSDLDAWRLQARQRLHERLLSPDTGGVPQATLQERINYDGLAIERLTWQLPYGPPTEALFLKPAQAKGRLPAVLALHDHGMNKYFGAAKIARTNDNPHPVARAHQDLFYGGVGWANELAKRGYAVLVHDAFAFASRRIQIRDLCDEVKAGRKLDDTDAPSSINAYNAFAAEHESVLAKSLFSAGTTWPGMFVAEDQRALDYLCSRPDVDASRVGCGGLSCGGLRTVYLAGVDERIACACCAGMMTTWRDYLLNKSYTHTWMVYIPGLPLEMDYPEILGLAAPKPALVINCSQDTLYTLSEMHRADSILSDVYAKAGASDRYQCSFYPGAHKLDRPMQEEAFAWFDRWLQN